MERENYRTSANSILKVIFCLIAYAITTIGTIKSQNIFGLEPIQVVGQMNGYSTAATSNSSYRKVSIVTGNPTDGRGQWFKTYNVQSSGGDFTPRNMTGGGGSGFLFISGPSSNRFANKWVFTGVGQGGVNVVNTCNAYNSGNDMGLNMNTAGYYSFSFNDAGYTVSNAKYYVAYTASTPVNVSRATQRLNFDRTSNIEITTSASPSSGENVYVRYTTAADFSSANSSSVVQANGSGTAWTASIPAQTAGSTVRYFVFSSTVSLATLSSMSELDKSLSTLKYDDNSGLNYSYTLTNAFVSVASGNFTDTATWGVSQFFSGASYTISNSHVVALDQDMTVSNLTINAGGTFDNSSFTLNVLANGSLNNNGAYSVTSGKLNYIGAGTLSGSQSCSLNDLTINSGSLTLSQVPTINGTLLINGGNVSAAPIYGSASTLAYNVTYNRFNEWNANGIGVIGTTAGYPNNVVIRSGTFDVANSSTVARALNGSLTVNSGATMNANTANMTLNIATDLINNGVFSTTNGTVVFIGNCSISGNACIFNNLSLNGNTSLNNVTVNGTLNFNAGASITSGTLNYGSASTLKYNVCPSSIGTEWPSSGGPFNVTLSSNAGALTLNGSKTINGSLTIGSASTLDVSTSHYTLNIGNNGSIINNGTFNAQSGIVAFAGAATVSGTISFYDVSISGGVNFGSSTTLNNRLFILPNGYVNTNPCTYAAGSTLIYNNGSTYLAGSEWLPNITSGAGVPFYVQVGNGNANSALSLGNAAYTLKGSLTIDTSAGSALIMGNASSVLNIAGDFINNGNNAANLNPGSGRINFNGTSTQNISGSNVHTSAFTFNSISVNNANGLILNKPISLGSNGILTLTNGTITTGATNSLSINNTSVSAISGASSTSFINGPISRALPTNYSTSSSYLFPIGKASNYMPLTLVNPKTGAGSITITANVENANCNGSVGSMLSAISNTEYWQLTASGNFTNSSISLARNTSNGIYNAIARSTSLSGIYNSIGGTVSTNSILNSDTTSGNDQYFVLGSSSVTTINAIGGVVANPGSGSSGYYGSTITVSGTQLSGVTELRIGGSNGRIIPIVSQTDTSITILAQDTSGLIYVTDGNSSAISNETYTHLGYISNASGNWNTTSTWLGNTIPALTSSAYVKDSVDLLSSITQSNLNILTSGKLNIINGATLSITNLSNAGLMYVNGSLSINDYSSNLLNGIINCSNNGSINLNDTLSNLGAVNMQGLFGIFSSGRILNNGPIYTSTSNLYYSTASNYIRGKEWSAVSGSGYPNHITINNNTTLNIGTLSSAIALAGNLNLGDGIGAGNLNMQSANQYIQVNGNLNIGSSIDTSTLTLSSSIGGDIKVAGNWTRTANGKFVNNTRAVFFIGSGLSEINGSGGAIFDYFISQKTASATIRLLSNLNVLASASGNAISLSSGTVVDLNGYSLNLTNSTSSNILVDGGVSTFTGISGSQINFSNGVKTITSSNAGSLLFDSNVKLIASNGGINFGVGLSTVNGSLQINSGGYVLTNPCLYGNASSLIYNNGSTYVVGSEWLSGIASGAGVPFHVKLGNGNANSALSLGNAAYTLRGSLTIDTSAGSALIMGNASSVLNIAGDFINNGNNAANLNPGSGRINFNGTSTQNISGSNVHSSAYTFNSISLNNPNGLILNKPISLGSNGILTLTNGTITTDATNSLSINNTSVSAISGASSTSFINGPISRALPTNYSTSSSYLFPIGKASNYMPLTLVNPKTGAGSITITANVENANCNGSVGSMLSAISNTEYWQLTASGNFTNSSISLARNTSNGIYNAIARSTSLSGIYNSIGGTVSTNSILNSDTTSGNDQYFVLGSSSVTTINASGGVVANPGSGSSGYYGSTITVSGTQLSGVTELRIGGSNGRIIPIVSQTDTSITILAQDTSGLIYVTDGNSSAISNETYTHLGYISNASGDWNTTSTWLGNTIPPISSAVYIKDSVDLSTSLVQSNLNITSLGKLNIINGDTLNISNLSNAGIVHVNGVLAINDYSTNSLSGLINCSNNGSINLNDTLSNLGAVNTQGLLGIFSSGRILNNGPIYTSTSNLYYSTGSNYSRGKEWSAVSGSGYPNHITINNSTTLNIGTLSSAIALAGNLNLGDGLGAGNLNMQSVNQYIQVNGNLNIGSSTDTSTLTLSSSIGGDIKVAGNWTRTANGKFVNNTRAVFFIGNGLSEINGSGGAIFDYFISQKTASATIRLLSNMTVLASASGNAISLSSGTVVDLNGYSLNLTNSTSSNILVDGGTASFSGIVGSQIIFTNGVKTITSSNAGNLTFGSNVKLIASNGGINFGVGLSTVNGSLQVNSGGYVLTNPCIYGNGSTLVYNTTGTYTAGTEWVSNLASGTGVPFNVTVSNNTNLSFGSTNQYRQVSNDITIANGSTLTLSTVAGGDIRIKGNWKNDNISVGQGLIHNNRAIILNGVANQSMTNESNVITIGYLLIDKPSGTAILNDSLTLNGTSGGTAQVLQLNNVGSLDLNGNVLTIAGNQVRSILCNASRLITGSSGSQLNFPSGTGVALIEGAGTLTLDSNINVSIYKGVNFGLNKTTIKGTLSIYPGSFCSTNSPLYGANANLIYNTGNYSTSNEWTLTSVPHNIKLNLTNVSDALSLSGNKQVSGILNINSGNVLTNSDTLFMNDGSTLNRNAGYVIGNLAKYFDASTNTSNTFEIGTSLGYTPITVSFPSISTSGFVTCKSNDSDFVSISSSGLKPAKSVNRNWLIASKDVSPALFNVLVNYLNTDNDNGVSLNFYKASIYDGAAWSSKFNPTISPSSTSASFSGISSFGNLQIGEDSTVSSSQTIINIKAFLQGFYTGAGLMNPAPFNADGVTPNTIADTIQIELHEANVPYSLAYSTIDTISTTGLANVNFPSTVIGNSYYVVLKHRNSMATWSSVPVLFSASGTSFDFSTSDAQAYGNNLIDDGNGVYLIYTGDINQDGSVDFNDYPDLDISSSNGDLGYLPYDLNGDASVDFNDYPLIDVNSSNGIFAITP